MKERRLLHGIWIYAVAMLTLVFLCAYIAYHRPLHGESKEIMATEPSRSTETVFVYVEVTEPPTQSSQTGEPVSYQVKAYEGKIGVFSDAGTLLEIWDVYVKTLPKTDQRLLEEGFFLDSEQKLNSLREDYTS